jgi:hypothetical protein
MNKLLLLRPISHTVHVQKSITCGRNLNQSFSNTYYMSEIYYFDKEDVGEKPSSARCPPGIVQHPIVAMLEVIYPFVLLSVTDHHACSVSKFTKTSVGVLLRTG